MERTLSSIATCSSLIYLTFQFA